MPADAASIAAARCIRTAPPAVGSPATFELCQQLVAAGGIVANVGVHGKKVDLHLETLWDRNIAITTRLVDTATIPLLFKTVAAKKIDPTLLITHHFKLDDILEAYETFGNAAKTKALKVIISAQQRAVVVEVSLVKIGQRYQTVEVVDGDMAPLKRQQAHFAQLPQHAVDVHRTQAKGISQHELRQRTIVARLGA